MFVSDRQMLALKRDDIRLAPSTTRNILHLGFPSFMNNIIASINSTMLNHIIIGFGGALALAALAIIALRMPLLRLFTHDSQTIMIGKNAMFIFYWCLPFLALSRIITSIMRPILLVPLCMGLSQLGGLGITGVWLALPLVDICIFAFSWYWLRCYA